MNAYFKIVPKEGEEMNFRVPETAFKLFIKTGFFREFLTITKTDVSIEDWGNYELKLALWSGDMELKSEDSDENDDDDDSDGNDGDDDSNNS